ncbi:MAG: hypothetical protein ACFE89_09040 [Candidatus Hodarchaeota archaeon]
MYYEELARPEVLNWLLESANPSVRYWALQHLKDLPSTNSEVQTTQQAILDSPVVKAFLSAQTPEGYWGKPDHIYANKYRATTHSFLILAELGLPRLSTIERGIEHLFSFQLDSGHFTTVRPKTAKGYASTISDTCCLDANIIYYLVHFGYLGDPRTQKTIQFLVDHYDKNRGGWKCRAYPINRDTVFPNECYMGLCKVLKAFSVFPESDRSPEINTIINQVIEVVLDNQIYKYLRNPDGSRKEKAGWKRFGYPLFYNSDILEVLDTLTRLNVRDPRMQDAINVVLETQQPDGKWLLKHTFNGKFYHDIEKKGKPSKWITLRALRVLKRYLSS